MLSHCAEWWDASNYLQSASAGTRSRSWPLHRPFVFFADTSAAAARIVDPSNISERDVSDGGARRRLLRVLRLLSARGGWQVCVPRSDGGDTSRTAAAVSQTSHHHAEGKEEEELVHVDWLDYITQRCVEADLRPAGDYDDFQHLLCSDTSQACVGCPLRARLICSAESSAGQWDYRSAAGRDGTALTFAVPDTFTPLSAVLWHVLAAEVEGVVLNTLHGLLQHYLWWPFLASSDRTGTSSETQTIDRAGALGYVRQALQTLVRTPEQVFACDLTHAAPNGAVLSAALALPPPVEGPITFSCVLPSSVCLLPLARDSESSRFFIHGIPESVAPDGVVLRRHPLRVLLVRVDPEGDWLPPPETLANQRTFYTSFNEQMGRMCAVTDDGEVGEDSNTDISEDFAVREAAGAGKRTVVRSSTDTASAKALSPFSPPSPLCGERSPTEDRVISELTEHVIGREPFGHAVNATRNADRFLWLAAIRLFVYALLHGVRVVITPERLPTFVKVFGYRHMTQLHRRLCEVREEFKAAAIGEGPMSLFADAAEAPTRAAAIALLDGLSHREPPIAVYVVDQVSLSGFTQLQVKSAVFGTTSPERSVPTALSSLPLSPVVLCRDLLRHPFSFDDVRGLSRPSGVCELAHCGVLDAVEMCRASLKFQSQRPRCSAEEIMTSCAAAVASGDRDASLMHDSRVLVVALPPLFTPALTDADGGASAPRTKRCAATQHRHGTDAVIWQATVDQAGLPQPLLPSVLLVAPTQLQAVHYGGLLRKAALALLETLPSPCTGEVNSVAFTHDSSRAVWRSAQEGVVRGGGAFFVSLARQIQWLMRQLSLLPAYTPSAGVDVEGPGSSLAPAAVSWGIGVSPQDRVAVRFVLAILCESCGAMVTRLAEPLIERNAAAGPVLSPLHRAKASLLTRGPRARRRLWMEALRAAVESPSTVHAEPLLHVYHQSLDMMFSGVSHGPVVDAGFGVNTLHEETMQWFASDRFLSSVPEPSTCGAAHAHHRGGATKPSFCLYPFLEPLHTNTRAVREALALVFWTLSATVS
ncbi:hypothetical protein JKF63_02694 [Porcisia hertigi]|uniref:Uncharacterized protein n=1 Tax=Porcisia hertigi TaxID=2761500 RepID=A0A836H9Z8_9TRYP|nr:hypothetical protein JKF63_02694 [Porcisia hertigi]